MTEPEPIDVERANLEKVNVHPTGPSEEDEGDVLASLYFFNSETGIYYEARYGD